MNPFVFGAVALVFLTQAICADEKDVHADFDQLVRQLASKSFQEREAAIRRLRAYGEESLSALRKAHNTSADLEQRGRLGRIIETIEQRQAAPIRSFVGHTRKVCTVALAPDGKSVLTGGFEGQMCLWDSDGKQIRRFAFTAQTVVFSPDGRLAATSGLSSLSEVCLWDIEGKEVQSFVGHRGSVYGLDYSRDGKYLATGGFDGSVRIWEVATGKELRHMNCDGIRVWSVAFSPDGSQKCLAPVS